MLKKLKSLFVIEENSAAPEEKFSAPKAKVEKTKSVKSEPENYTPTPTPTPSPSPSPSPPVSDGKIDQKFVDILLKAIDHQNMDGFDYLEYKQSLQSLSKMDMDEVTKYKSAFAMAKTMGATQSKLVQSAEKYIQILVHEEQKFEDALKNQKAKQNSDRQSQIQVLEKNIVAKENQIKSLQKEIESSRTKLENERSMIDKAAAKMETTKDRFERAYQMVVGQIKDDLKKIKEYL